MIFFLAERPVLFLYLLSVGSRSSSWLKESLEKCKAGKTRPVCIMSFPPKAVEKKKIKKRFVCTLLLHNGDQQTVNEPPYSSDFTSLLTLEPCLSPFILLVSLNITVLVVADPLTVPASSSVDLYHAGFSAQLKSQYIYN